MNAWRAFDRRSADRLLSGAPISFIHLLSYTSACVNPIIYCFMNKRFRQGFLATFSCCGKKKLNSTLCPDTQNFFAVSERLSDSPLP